MIDLKFLLAMPFIVWTISQTLKVCYRLFIRGERFSKEHVLWIYMYGDGVPSTHSALLVSMLVVVWKTQGVGLLLYVALTVSLVLVYNLLESRKKQMILESYFNKSGIPALQEIPTDGRLMDMSGHNFLEIGAGVIVGAVLGMLFTGL